MTEREMLELAAKAVNFENPYSCKWDDESGCIIYPFKSDLTNCHLWNPVADDGDALRLAVKLDIHIEQNTTFKRACALWYGKNVLREEVFVPWGNDKYAAARLAIVTAAVEIGKLTKPASLPDHPAQR